MPRQYRFHLNAAQSPTHYNLVRYLQEQNWNSSWFACQADFSDANLQFHNSAAEHLEFKHYLACLVAQYCPEVMPLTYCLNETTWPQVLQNLAQDFYWQEGQFLDQREDLVWILKPALLNNGQAIKIFQRLSDLEKHFLSSRRLGGEHVLQHYLTKPHLLREKHKYSIRMFVVLTNYAGAYLYPQGYFNIALHPFTPIDFGDLRPHLTNEHLCEGESNVIQIPSNRFAFFPELYPQIKTIVSASLSGLAQGYPQAFCCLKQPTLALFGFDFMVDVQGRVWFLEANHGPCFPLSDEHPLQSYLYADFWQAFISSFVLPIAEQRKFQEGKISVFDKILSI